jgi:multidrug efflux pump subunit AcrB
MALAVFVMYVILAILYESYLHPLTVLSTLPTALVGGLLTLVLGNKRRSMRLWHVYADGHRQENGIMIVDFALQQVAAGDPRIHDASMDRFRPILMTTLAAVIGACRSRSASAPTARRAARWGWSSSAASSCRNSTFITPVIYLYRDFQEKSWTDIVFPFLTRCCADYFPIEES